MELLLDTRHMIASPHAPESGWKMSRTPKEFQKSKLLQPFGRLAHFKTLLNGFFKE